MLRAVLIFINIELSIIIFIIYGLGPDTGSQMEKNGENSLRQDSLVTHMMCYLKMVFLWHHVSAKW